jgi:hypothetical protein
MTLTGAVAVAVLAAVAVGFVLTSGGPLSVVDLHASPPPAPVAGSAGLVPGAPATEIPFMVVGTATTGEVTASTLEADAASLPLACPPEAWDLTLPRPVRIVTPAVPTPVVVRVALSDDAPTGCQGVTVPALTATVHDRTAGEGGARLSSSAERALTVATLGTPGVAVTRDGAQAVVVVTADPLAPPSTHYTVEAAGADGRWRSVCQLSTPAPCATGLQADDGSHRYRVTARLGSFWRRTSAVVQA